MYVINDAEFVFFAARKVIATIPNARLVMMGRSFRNHDYGSFSAALSSARNISAPEIRAWAENLYQHHNWPRVARDVAQAIRALE